MRPPPSSIWFEAAAKISRQKTVTAFSGNQEKVLDYLWTHHPGLYQGSPNEAYSKEAILEISRDLSKGVTTANKRERFDFLSRGLERGNLSLPGWDVPLGPVYVKVKREENYSRQDLFRPISQAGRLVEALGAALESSAPPGRSALLGQIMLSAVLFGGLLNRKWLHPFQESLLNKRIFQEGTVFWVDLIEPETGKRIEHGNKESSYDVSHRLTLDNLTRLLIYRYFRLEATTGQTRLSRDPWYNISGYMKGAFPPDLVPGSLTELISWAMARYLTILPHSLVAFASGKLEAVSLPTAPWLRTISGMIIPVSRQEPASPNVKDHAKPRIVDNGKSRKTDQQSLLSDLLKDLRTSKNRSKKRDRSKANIAKAEGKISPLRARRIVTLYLHNNRSVMSATLQLLLYWSLRLLDEKVDPLELRHKDTIRPTSVDRYLSSIGYTLLIAARDLPLHRLRQRDLEAVYEQVVVRLEGNRYAMDRLRQFHGFMRVFFNARPMEWGELFDIGGPAKSAVNANLIDSRVYSAVLGSLGWGNPDLTRWQTLHLLALILLYRCGLRPSELQALRLKDLQGISRYEILVRDTSLNDIKTENGIRRLPVSEMLPAVEWEFFLEYYRTRLSEDDNGYGDGIFLTHPVHHGGLLTDDELFAPVRKALRSITKDENVILYHLRHSFVTRIDTVLHLEKATHTWELPDVMIPAEDREIVINLFHSLSRNEQLGRKDQYLLAMLVGHASAATTHRHYCHLMDFSLGIHLNSPDNCCSISLHIIMALTGLQRSAAYELLKPSNDTHPLQKTVKNEAASFAAELRHPLMASASPIKNTRKALRQSEGIKLWEEAVRSLPAEKLTQLRRSKIEWDFAAKLYEAIRLMARDGRKEKTSRKVIHYLQGNYSERWGGVSYSKKSDAKLLVNLLKECGIPELDYFTVYHPIKNEPEIETIESINKWSEILGIPNLQITSGECVPNKLHVKNMITIKVLSEKYTATKLRSPKMSQGFMAATMLLYNGGFK